MRLRLMLCGVLLAGCTREDEFRVDLDAASCTWQAECNTTIEFDACMDAADASWEPVPDACRFRRKKANQCLEAFDDLACPGSGTVELPIACDEVWDCD